MNLKYAAIAYRNKTCRSICTIYKCMILYPAGSLPNGSLSWKTSGKSTRTRCTSTCFVSSLNDIGNLGPILSTLSR